MLLSRRLTVTPKKTYMVSKPWIVLKPKPVRKIIPKAMPEWMNSVEFVGHGIIYFTLFYCSMNWIYYRNTRLDFEKQEKKSKNDEKKK